MNRQLLLITCFLLSVSCTFAQQVFTTNQQASFVLGQPNFTTSTASCTQLGLNNPGSVAISSKGVVAIGEQVGGRVKLYKSLISVNNPIPDVMVGKPDYTTCSGTTLPTQSAMGQSDGVAFSPDGNKLIVCDVVNNRVLIWNSIPTTDGQAADVVLGHTDFITRLSGANPTSMIMRSPVSAVVSPDGRLIVSCYGQNRVLIWNSIPATNGTPADVVVGQTDFTTTTSGVNSAKLYGPWGICVSPDGKLLVADALNNRVLIWNKIPVANGTAADVVMGQTSFVYNTAGVTQSKFTIPLGISVSNSGQLAIADANNSRILLYNSIPTTYGAVANTVLGQANFTTSFYLSPSDDRDMSSPYGVAFDSFGRLFVAQRLTHRTTIYGTLPTDVTNLGIGITASGGISCSGSDSSMTIMVTNNSATDATGVLVSTMLPAAVNYGAHTASIGNYNPESGIWNIGTIAANSSMTLQLNGIIKTAGTHIAFAKITQINQVDSDYSNNGANTSFASAAVVSGPTTNDPSYTFCSASTVAGLQANGSGIKWYTTAFGGTALATTDALATGNYYASQTISGCESLLRTKINVTVDVSGFCNSNELGNNAEANLVIGQATFATQTDGCTQTGLSNPYDVATSSKGVMAVADGYSVKLWTTPYISNGQAANVVVGKSDFTTCSTVPVSQTFLRYPGAVAFSADGNRLIVSDSDSNRILIWNSIPTTNGQPADVVLGQQSFTGNTASAGASGLNYPTKIVVTKDGKLLVCDSGNRRVLIWNSIPFTNGAPANVVVGHIDFALTFTAVSATSIMGPSGIAISPDGKLLVSDEYGHRVMVWNSVPTSNGIPANVVIGQESFTANGYDLAPNRFYSPRGISVASDGTLAIADANNKRVVIYNSIPTVNNAAADIVLGQPNLQVDTFGSSSPSNKNLRLPVAVSYDNYGRLMVIDRYFNRGMIFGAMPTQQADLSTGLTANNTASCSGNINTLTVTITNNSEIAAEEVIAETGLPAEMPYLSHITSTGNYIASIGQWGIGTIPANSSVTLTLNGLVSVSGNYSASARITQLKQLDPDLSNNTFSLDYTLDEMITAPSGNTSVTTCSNATIADLEPSGVAIKWYTSAIGGTLISNSTSLINGGNYFASQTVAGCESLARLKVTVNVNTGVFCNNTAITNFQAADYVIGQTNFSGQSSACSATGVEGTSYTAISSKGVLAVAEQTGGKVKLWKSPYVANGTPADVVIGKPDFITCTLSNTPTQSLTRNSDGVAFSPDGNKLVVSDSGNNRVLIWNSIPTTNGQPADVVLGQATFTTNATGISATGFNYPTGVFVSQDGKLFVSDFRNNRILIWNSIPATNGAAADLVLGQDNFTTNTAGNSALKMNQPWGIWVSPDGKLLVADSSNHRVLVWNSVPTTNGAAADIVIGQTGFDLSTSGTAADKLFTPPGVTVSTDGKLAIGDFNNKRVLIYNSIPTVNGASADTVLGQPDFNSAVSFAPAGIPSSNNMNFPYNVSFDLYGRLFVVGRDMHRGMVFGKIPTQEAELAISIVSSSNLNCSGNANTVTITLTNNSSTAANGVIATASFPNAISYSSHTASVGSFNPVSGYWNIGNVPANSSITLVIDGITGTAGDFTANASILHSNQLDANMANNADGILLTIGNPSAPVYAGGTSQSFCDTATIGDLSNGNSSLKWFSTSTGGTPLALTTPLTNGGIYFATQNPGCDVIPRIAVTTTIITTPVLAPVSDVAKCFTYSLPELSQGNYFTAANGAGNPLFAGDEITESQTIYIFAETGTGINCTAETSFDVQINQCTQPYYGEDFSICEGSDPQPLLPYTDSGVSGTWSPAEINTTETTTYTFTPNDDANYLPINLTITVEPIVVPEFDQVPSICPGGDIYLPGTSNNDIGGDWSPTINNMETTTYTFTPFYWVCATPITMTVAVGSAIPTFDPVAAICEGTALTALPLISNNGISGTWSPALNNMQTTTYTFTPDDNSCAQATTLTITVSGGITPTFNAVPAICSDENLAALPTISLNGISGTWSPALNNVATTTYTFTPNDSCAVSTTMTITVNPNVTPTFNAVPAICSGGNLAALPTISLNGITGTWLPALNNSATTTYTFTPNSGQCALSTTMTITVDPNVSPTFTSVAAICSGGNLAALPTTSLNGISGTWSPALNNLATTTYTFTPNSGQCALSTTMTITVDPNVTPTFTAVTAICSGGNLAALPTISLNGISGTWSPALNNVATTTYTFTPNSGQCALSTTMTITVNPNITPTFNAVAAICSGGNLATLPTTSINGISGTWSPALNNVATTTYTFTPSSGQCAISTTITITVNPNVTPTFNAVAAICSGGNLVALPTTSINGISGTWSPALNNLATTTYTFTPNSGQCALSTTMTITVNPNVTPTFTAVAAICSGGNLAALPTNSTNGITGTWSPALNNVTTTTYTFTPNAEQCALSTIMTITVNPNVTPTFNAVPAICSGGNLAALPTTSINGISGTWSPALNNVATTTYTFTPNSAQCALSTTMTITVNSIDLSTSLASETITANQSGATYQWINCNGNVGIQGANSQSFTATENGNYAVIISVGNCSATSECIAINTLNVESITNVRFTIYPNPVASILYLKHSASIIIDTIVIYDVTGKMILSQSNQASEINVEKLAVGTYIIHAHSGSKLYQERFIKK